MGGSNSTPAKPPDVPEPESEFMMVARENVNMLHCGTMSSTCNVVVAQRVFNFVTLCILDCESGIMQEFRAEGLTKLNEAGNKLVLCMILSGEGGWAVFIDSKYPVCPVAIEVAVLTEMLMNRERHEAYKKFVGDKLQFIREHYNNQFAQWSAQYTLCDCDPNTTLDWDQDLSVHQEDLNSENQYSCTPLSAFRRWR